MQAVGNNVDSRARRRDERRAKDAATWAHASSTERINVRLASNNALPQVITFIPPPRALRLRGVDIDSEDVVAAGTEHERSTGDVVDAKVRARVPELVRAKGLSVQVVRSGRIHALEIDLDVRARPGVGETEVLAVDADSLGDEGLALVRALDERGQGGVRPGDDKVVRRINNAPASVNVAQISPCWNAANTRRVRV
jgi:hypothetical protein